MSQKEHADATWEDMDWGQFEPSGAVAKAAPVEGSPLPPSLPPAPAPAVVTPPVVINEQAVAAAQRYQIELEHVKVEAELARMQAELVEQQRRLAAAQQASREPALEMPRTLPLDQDIPATVRPVRTEGAGAAFVFNPGTLATLTLVSEGGGEAQVTIKDAFSVGRAKGNDLVIRDLHVSGQHAKFTVLQDGVFEIADLGSSGGTFVNGQRVERCALKSGDKIEFATVAATFRYVAGDLLDPADEYEGTLVHSKAEAARMLAAVSHAPLHGMLSVLSAHEQSRAVPIGGQITIGRALGNDLIISQEHVSGRHARLAGNGSNGFELFDLGSSCGTYVNGVQGSHWTLKSGDRLRFGVVDCVFIIIEPEGAAPNASKPPLPRSLAMLPQIEDSGVKPLPEPRPAARAGDAWPSMRNLATPTHRPASG